LKHYIWIYVTFLCGFVSEIAMKVFAVLQHVDDVRRYGRKGGGGSFMCCYRATKCQVLANFLYFNKFFRLKLVESEMPHIFSMVPAEVLYLSKFFYKFGSDVTQTFSRNRTSLSFRHTHREDNVVTFLGTMLVNTATHKRRHLLETHYNICLL